MKPGAITAMASRLTRSGCSLCQTLTVLVSRRPASSGLATGIALSLLLPLGLLEPPGALSQSTRHALACIGTETGYTVNFSYRWGNHGAWSNTSVAPGRWRSLTWNYDYPGENHSPKLTIRYDDDTTTDTNIVQTELSAYAARGLNCEAQGKTYNFYQRGNELYVQTED